MTDPNDIERMLKAVAQTRFTLEVVEPGSSPYKKGTQVCHMHTQEDAKRWGESLLREFPDMELRILAPVGT